jgi:hypothetical protein
MMGEVLDVEETACGHSEVARVFSEHPKRRDDDPWTGKVGVGPTQAKSALRGCHRMRWLRAALIERKHRPKSDCA